MAEPGLGAAAAPSPVSITTSRPQGLAGRGCGELPTNAARASPAVPRRAHLGLCVPSGSWLEGGARGRPPSRSKLCLLLSVDECQRRRPGSAAAAVERSAARAGGVGVGSSHVCQARSSSCYPASALPAASASLPAVSRSRGPCSCEPRMFAVRKASSGAHSPRPTCLRPAHGSCKGSGADWARGAALL